MKDENSQSSAQPPIGRAMVTGFSLFARFGEVGFIIAIPLVILLFVGSKLDQHFDSSPLFLFVALGLSIISTSWGITRFVKSLPH